MRERFLKVMRRKEEGYVPFEFGLCPSLIEEFKKRTGSTDAGADYAKYYDFPVRGVRPAHLVKENRFLKYYKGQEGVEIDLEWGAGKTRGSVAHFEKNVFPMKDFTSLEEFKAYPYPDPIKDYGWAGLPDKIKAVRDAGLATHSRPLSIFETAWDMRGMEIMLMDFALNEELANYHLDRVTRVCAAMAGEYAKAGTDVLKLGDDVATQLDMMMSPGVWRSYLKPRLKAVVEAAKKIKPDILVFYHGDGNMRKIIPDLIEVGIDIINPVQPECMDPYEIKKEFGKDVSFWGALGTQTTMPFGTPEQVKETCNKLIKELGKGGGFLLGPTHMLEPEVPWKNVEAYIETVKEHNKEQG